MTDRPNVLLITIDTLRQDVLGCYGHPRAVSPNIDAVAASGLRFTQAITAGSWTQAAFPAMLTSSYASMYGGCLGQLAPARPSPIEALAQYGYSTIGFSTNPHLRRETGYDRGFGSFRDLIPHEREPLLRRVRGGQRLLRNTFVHYLAAMLGKKVRPAHVSLSAADVTDAVVRELDRVSSPFVAWVHYMDTHWPYHVEDNLEDPRQLAQAWQDVGIMHRRANFKRRTAITTRQRERFIALYHEALAYLDLHIGRLLDSLERSGHGPNTIVIITSDHGEEFLEHGRWGHWESNLFDEIIKVPLIIRVPGDVGGHVIARQVRLLDLMPTILEVCGCPTPTGMEGTSMTPLWRETEGEYDVAESVSEMHRPPWHRIAVRTERYKFIWDNKCPEQSQLFDLWGDPAETRDVSSTHPREIAAFQSRVEAHLRLAAMTAQDGASPAPRMDDAVVSRLRALGYVD